MKPSDRLPAPTVVFPHCISTDLNEITFDLTLAWKQSISNIYIFIIQIKYAHREESWLLPWDGYCSQLGHKLPEWPPSDSVSHLERETISLSHRVHLDYTLLRTRVVPYVYAWYLAPSVLDCAWNLERLLHWRSFEQQTERYWNRLAFPLNNLWALYWHSLHYVIEKPPGSSESSSLHVAGMFGGYFITTVIWEPTVPLRFLHFFFLLFLLLCNM